MHRIQINPILIKGKTGYDIRIIDQEATIQDYISALENAFLNTPFTRTRNTVASCAGCQYCCNERIPLTSIDIYQLMNFMIGHEITPPHTNINEFISKYGYVIINQSSIDIMLRKKDNFCIFLNNVMLCRYHDFRPLVCRTYFCCPSSKKADKLRAIIVNKGEDDLVRLWLETAQYSNTPLSVDEAYEATPELKDWPLNPFSTKRSYEEIKIKDICPDKLWLELTK